MLKIKTDIYLAIFLLFFVCACAHDEMDEMPLTQDEIKFVATSGKVTRAGGETSLAKYIDNFRVYGINTNNTNTLVFDNYVLWYDQQLSNSNTHNWEYVGQNPIDHKLQTIKYWNFSADQYYFWAVAGAEDRSFTPNSNGMIETFSTTMTEVDGSASVLYYSKPLKVNRNNYSHPVTFHFVGAHSRMRMAFYETIPGYAVKDVQFHISTGATQLSECTANGSFNVAGTLNLDYNNNIETPDVTCSFTGTKKQASHSFGSLNYTTAASGALAQNGKSDYLGVLSSAPTYAGNPETPGYYTNILPSPDNNTPLTIKVDYTLVSLDGSGQEINITGADATVPAEFCRWKSNYSYTYLFKISDDKLKPITFVAVGEIDNTTDNEQGTITTMGEYSITTHQNGDGDTDADGIAYEPYVVGKHIEIAVSKAADGALQEIALTGSNDYVKIYHQTTSYEWIVETTTGTGAVSVDYNTSGIAYFNPEKIGTYRIEYWHKEGDADAEKKAVKIVSVGAQLYSTDHTGTDLGNGGDSNFKPIETH